MSCDSSKCYGNVGFCSAASAATASMVAPAASAAPAAFSSGESERVHAFRQNASSAVARSVFLCLVFLYLVSFYLVSLCRVFPFYALILSSLVQIISRNVAHRTACVIVASTYKYYS